MSDDAEALVIGAGVVGVTTAYALARRGISVTIVDRAGEAGRGTSFANGAQLSYLYTDALASPAMLQSVPRMLLALEPAFRLRPSLDPDFIRWGLHFLRNCTASRFRRNTLEGLKLGLESRRAMHNLLERHALDFGYEAGGKLHLIEGRSAMQAARSTVKLKQEMGARQQLITPAEAVRLEPALAERAQSLSGAIYSPQEEVGDPYRFCAALLARLKAQYGVRTRLGGTVRRLEVAGARTIAVMDDGERHTARHVAVCAGIDAPKLLAGAGIKVPIWPMKGYSLTARPGPQAPRMSVTDVARRIVFCPLSNTIRIAGLADLGHRDTTVDPRRLRSLTDAAKASLPAAADYDAPLSNWAGLRPMTPSSLPIIRRERGGILLNVGHGTLGWTFAMGAAERAAALAMEGRA